MAGLVVLAVALFVLPDRGWDSSTRPSRRAEARLSAEAARIAGHEARVHCDAEGEAVGIVQHADGLAEVGGTNAFTPEICFRLHRVTEGDEGPFSQTARRSPRLRTRRAPPRRIGRRRHELLRVPERGLAGAGSPLGADRGLDMRQQLADNATFARSASDYPCRASAATAAASTSTRATTDSPRRGRGRGEGRQRVDRNDLECAACVAPSTTGGVGQRDAPEPAPAHTHQRSPGSRPSGLHSGRGVERSLPASLLKARNSSVITAQTVCEPTSSGPVEQQPSRKKPVTGAFEQGSSSPPTTFTSGSRLIDRSVT